MPDAPRPSLGGLDTPLGAGASSPTSLDRPFTVPLLIRGSTGGTLLGTLLLLFGGFFALGIFVQMQSRGDPPKLPAV